MFSDVTTSEICRICAKPRTKFVKTEGIYRDVIFDLMSEISGVVSFLFIFLN